MVHGGVVMWRWGEACTHSCAHDLEELSVVASKDAGESEVHDLFNMLW